MTQPFIICDIDYKNSLDLCGFGILQQHPLSKPEFKNVYSLCLSGTSYSKGDDGKRFTNALYGNGPGYQIVNGTRPDMNDTVSSKF